LLPEACQASAVRCQGVARDEQTHSLMSERISGEFVFDFGGGYEVEEGEFRGG